MNGQSPVHRTDRVLVVGTTSDYIDWIRRARPGQAIFLTAPSIRDHAVEPSPDEGEEILCDFGADGNIEQAVQRHVERWGMNITGIACFDCESLALASGLAGHFNLPFSGLDAIQNCRDKFISKQIWKNGNVPCPRVAPITDRADVIRFFEQTPGGIVLKPFLGSGSELVFKCRSKSECTDAFEAIRSGLITRKDHPLFKQPHGNPHLMVAEEWISGPEYSCDFIIDNGKVAIIRKTRKIKVINRPFGTVSGYVLSPDPNEDGQPFADMLRQAATALGIKRSICMVDYFYRDGAPVFIELTPRPGGDCLPFLLKEAGGLDILGITLDFAQEKPVNLNGSIPYRTQVGIRIHAHKPGILQAIDTSGIEEDVRVKSIHMIRPLGHRITMPPEDYDSWLLGHLIVAPEAGKYPETSSMLIAKRINVEIQTP